MSDLNQLIDRLRTAPEFAEQVVHYRHLPAAEASWHSLKGLSAPLRKALKDGGIEKLYSHQWDALRLLREGKNVGITTPTASGKTLIYNLAVIETLLADPQAHALYIFPLKALAQDQLKTLSQLFERLGTKELSAAIYDGDTPASARAKIKRKPPRILITNPDMLHYGLLAFPEGWRGFFHCLRFVVVDEAHSYRGVFGSHVALILRRLQRLCGEPGPRFVASSATMANAGEFLQRLTNKPFTLVEKSGAPREGRHVLLLDPAGSPYTEAAGLLRECVKHKIKTILFTQSRKITELISRWVQESSPAHAKRIASYRSGYLPEERRLIEQRLFRDELSAVISTSALESGIDVGGLDACILAGYPGTMISLWQRLGRAGRAQREALLIMIALPDALDHYYLRHPEALFASRFENCVLDPENPQLLDEHLPCAAAESPLTAADWPLFGATVKAAVERLTQRGDLRGTVDGTAWLSKRKQPQREVDIRSSDEPYAIKLERKGILLGHVDAARVFKECHPGAIYLHAGVTYEITTLDLDTHTVLVSESRADWYTQYTASEEVGILDLPLGQMWRTSRQRFTSAWVRVRVTEKVVSYERHRVKDQTLLSEHKLSLPPRIFETQAVLLTVPDPWRRRCQERGQDFSGGIHAAEHVLIAALPTQVICERWDLGGLSTLVHPQVDQPCIFVYDGYPGGVGLAEKGLDVLEAWVKAARDMVEGCECGEGCPSCVQSPKCGSRNHPLDKSACRAILGALHREGAQRLQAPEPQTKAGTIVEKKEIKPYTLNNPAADSASAPAVPEARPEVQAPVVSKDFRLLVFDLETRKSAAEVGGWQNAHLMRISVAVVYDALAGGYRHYREEQVQELMQDLLAADLVVGFNIDGFDLKVLSGYSEFASRIRTFDILSDLRRTLGFRLSLDHLAQHTLGRGKTAEGLQAIAWFQQGNWTDLESYCRADVEITRDLFWFGHQFNYVLYERQGQILKLPVAWGASFPKIQRP
jgi:DEAD/DEAH box helicase domain-containing protein